MYICVTSVVSGRNVLEHLTFIFVSFFFSCCYGNMTCLKFSLLFSVVDGYNNSWLLYLNDNDLCMLFCSLVPFIHKMLHDLLDQGVAIRVVDSGKKKRKGYSLIFPCSASEQIKFYGF